VKLGGVPSSCDDALNYKRVFACVMVLNYLYWAEGFGIVRRCSGDTSSIHLRHAAKVGAKGDCIRM